MKKNWLEWIVYILAIIGCINWGLGIWDINLVDMVAGSISWLATTIYALVGLAGLYLIYLVFK